jgi:hypothetical protein
VVRSCPSLFAVYLALGAGTDVVDSFDQQIDQVINEGAAAQMGKGGPPGQSGCLWMSAQFIRRPPGRVGEQSKRGSRGQHAGATPAAELHGLYQHAYAPADSGAAEVG